jgi:hypothetical protein
MPHSSDDPSSDRISAEAPSAPPTEGVKSHATSPSQPSQPAENVSTESDPQGRIADSGEGPKSPRRRRRRRRPPRAISQAETTAARQGPAEQATTGGDVPQNGDLPAMLPNAAGPRRRRRRRRGLQREPGSAELAAGGVARPAERAPELSPNIGQASAGEPREGPSHQQPRNRRRRRRPPRPAEASAAEVNKIVTGSAAEGTRARAPQYRSAPYRGSRNRGARNPPNGHERAPQRGPLGDNRRSLDRRPRGNGAPGRNHRQLGRDRDAPRKKPEQRLYALEAIVDRGFEDVVDAAEDNHTRRVHWTIIKRTVADQESGKPISATYVLRRDGVDTEFSGLAAARAAANKTIVHPEKLTVSKAEHAAERAAAKK